MCVEIVYLKYVCATISQFHTSPTLNHILHQNSPERYWFVTGEYFFVSEEEFKNQKLKPIEDVVVDNCQEYLKLNEGFKEEMFPENLMKESDKKNNNCVEKVASFKKSNTMSIFDRDMDGDVDENDKNFDVNQVSEVSQNENTKLQSENGKGSFS